MSFAEDVRDCFRTAVQLGEDNDKLRAMLADCVTVIEAVIAKSRLVTENDEISEALETAVVIYWATVTKSGEVDAPFEGHEDLEPGDPYWCTGRRWAEIVAASKKKPSQG